MNTRLHTLRSKTTTSKGGFSLAELMVVIVILGLLATLVVPAVFDRLKQAFAGKAKSDIMAIDSAIGDFLVSNGGRFPDSLQDLVDTDENGYRYLKQMSVPMDPWGTEYQYEPPVAGQTTARVFTLGKDGVPGGEGDNEDMSNIKFLGGEDL
ncbi:MAG: general secretion pathway protein G [Candidatus Paceibacteria bacterium]|jgi:general secretion pathway protein G